VLFRSEGRQNGKAFVFIEGRNETKAYNLNDLEFRAILRKGLNQVLSKRGFKPKSVTFSWKCGCSCGCSPGFHLKGLPKVVYITLV